MAQILLIEDDQILRRALRLSLEKTGHLVVEAGDGREGLAAFQRQPADLVITDLIMPGMEGVETIRELKKAKPSLLIIAMSGGGRVSSESYLKIAQQFGAAKVFAKPFELRALCEAVAGLLGETGISERAVMDRGA